MVRNSLVLSFLLLGNVISITAQDFGLNLIGHWDREGLTEIDKQSYSDIWGWHDGNGREYAIMGSLDSIYFIEVTDPKKPILRDVEAGKAVNVIHRDFKTYQRYCYAHGDEGYSSLQVFDMSYLPDSVKKVYDSDKEAYRVHNLHISGDKLYLASVKSARDGFLPLRVLSLEDPENPKFLFDLDPPVIGVHKLFRDVHDLFVRNDSIYCATGDDGLYSFIYSDSTTRSDGDSSWRAYSPNATLMDWGILPDYQGHGYTHSNWLNRGSDYMVLADETHGTKLKLVHFDWKNPPEIVSVFGKNAGAGSIPHNPFIHKKLVYVSYYHEGILVYDIHNPKNPTLIGSYDTYDEQGDFSGMYGCWGVYPFLPSGTLIASDQLQGLLIFDEVTATRDNLSVNRKFQLFPNPTNTGRFTIKTETSNLDEMLLEIRDLTGQLVYHRSSLEQSMEINLESDQPKGMYFVHLIGKESNEVHKVILR